MNNKRTVETDSEVVAGRPQPDVGRDGMGLWMWDGVLGFWPFASGQGVAGAGAGGTRQAGGGRQRERERASFLQIIILWAIKTRV